jgi:hypothetical protein
MIPNTLTYLNEFLQLFCNNIVKIGGSLLGEFFINADGRFVASPTLCLKIINKAQSQQTV